MAANTNQRAMYGAMSVLPEELIMTVFQASMPIKDITMKITLGTGCSTCANEMDPMRQWCHKEYKEFLEGARDRENIPKDEICKCTHCAECLYDDFRSYKNVMCPSCEKYKSWQMASLASRVFF